jgi:hypothetical protein
MVAPYFMIDLTRVTYVVFRHVSWTFLKFLCLLYRTIKKEEDHLTLQADLKHLEEWANKWGMRFNTPLNFHPPLLFSLFLANNLRFMIVKTIVINGKIHKNKRKRFYSSNKEGLIWGTL